MRCELLVMTVDQDLFQFVGQQWETLWRSPQGPARDPAAHEDAVIEACEASQIQFCDQALQWMDAAEYNGARLALASSMSSRLVRTLMEAADGAAWADRFVVVATADALRPGEEHAELYRLILRTAEVPPHRAALVTASESHHQNARNIGMHVAELAGDPASLLELQALPDSALAFHRGVAARPPGGGTLSAG